MMKVLITGASTGIGREMALYMSKLGYDLYVVARDKEKLMNLKSVRNSSFPRPLHPIIRSYLLFLGMELRHGYCSYLSGT